jgi:putative pyrroloquinoline-quinone binding quinoprotein
MTKPAVVLAACFAIACAGCGKRYIGRVPPSAEPPDARDDSSVDADADADANADANADADTNADALPDLPDAGTGADAEADAADAHADADAADAHADAAPDLPDTGGATDAGDGGIVVPGTIAWSAPGRPASDGTARFYTRHEDPGGGYFWRIDPETGLFHWQIYEAVDFRCFGGATALFTDISRGTIGADTKRILVRASASGSLVWSGTLTRPAHFSCWQALDRFLAVENPGSPVLTAYRTSANQMLWRVPAAADATVDAADPETTYVSSTASGRTRLDALRSADGAPVWNVSFTSMQKLSFVFDAQRNLYAIDGSPGSSSLRRLSTANGGAAWTRSLSDGSKVILDGSSDLLLVKEGGRLLAIDKATNAVPWTHTPDPPSFPSWEATFMKSGDVLVTRMEGQVLYSVLGPDGAVRSTFGPAIPGRNGQSLFETAAGELYLVTSHTVVRLDPALNGAALWTFRDEAIDRVIGSDEERLLLAGPEIGCRPCFEQVIAVDKREGRFMWKVPGQLPSQNALWGTDAKRIYLSVPYGERNVPGTVTAIWK